MRCADCDDHGCEKGRDCTEGVASKAARDTYTDERLDLLRASAEVEARHYMAATRLEEIAVLARKMDVKRLGLAYCIGLSEEARMVSEYLGRYFDVHSVCCKVGGVSKDEFGLEHIHGPVRESTCNPAGQAATLEEAGTQLNVVLGLCVGHDAQFYRSSSAPVVTFATKDRVLAHNPLGAVYSRYHRERNLGFRNGDGDG